MPEQSPDSPPRRPPIAALATTAVLLTVGAGIGIGMWIAGQTPAPIAGPDANIAPPPGENAARVNLADTRPVAVAQPSAARNENSPVANSTATETPSETPSTTSEPVESAPQSLPRSEPLPAPLGADDSAVQALLQVLAFGDHAAVADIIDAIEADADVWSLLAGALLAAETPELRAMLAGMVAGKFPEYAWLADDEIFAAATAKLFADLLLAHPEWLVPDGAGYPPMQRTLLDWLLSAAAPLPADRAGLPFAFATANTAGLSGANVERLAALVAQVRQMDDAALQAKLLAFVGRSAVGIANAAELAPALLELAGILREPLDLRAAVFAAAYLADSMAGGPAILDALAHADSRGAALAGLNAAWNQARVEPTDALAARVIELATAAPGANGADAGTLSVAVDLAARWAAGGALSAESRHLLAARLDDAIFATPSPGSENLLAPRIAALTALRPEDAGLVPRLMGLVSPTSPASSTATVMGVGKLRVPAAADALLALARNSAQPLPARSAAMAALVARPDRRADTRDMLRAIATGNESGAIRADAIGWLAREFGTDAAVFDLAKELAERDASPAVRAAAMLGLARGCPLSRRLELHEFFAARAVSDADAGVRNAADRARTLLQSRR